MDALVQYLQNPEAGAGALTEGHLDALLKRYPWFTTARIVRSRLSGKVDPALSLRLMMRPVPELLLHRPSFDMSVEVAPEPAAAEPVAEATDATLGVIDRFLSHERVRMTPREGIPEGDIAAESVAEDDELVTEELAEIYLVQGLTARAVEVYGKLSLLYPEKSVYFAEIIGRIERNTDGNC